MASICGTKNMPACAGQKNGPHCGPYEEMASTAGQEKKAAYLDDGEEDAHDRHRG